MSWNEFKARNYPSRYAGSGKIQYYVLGQWLFYMAAVKAAMMEMPKKVERQIEEVAKAEYIPPVKIKAHKVKKMPFMIQQEGRTPINRKELENCIFAYIDGTNKERVIKIGKKEAWCRNGNIRDKIRVNSILIYPTATLPDEVIKEIERRKAVYTLPKDQTQLQERGII